MPPPPSSLLGAAGRAFITMGLAVNRVGNRWFRQRRKL
jgi:hypothetical protein